MNEQYERLKAKGHDLSWYEKSKKHQRNTKDGSAALNDEQCGILSIYLLDTGGKLWTTQSNGEPYMMARQISTKPATKVYVCVACQKRFSAYAEADKHYKKEEGKPE
jgi:hypothetical protein